MKGRTIKFVKGNIGEYLRDLVVGKYFLNSIQKVLTIKETIANWTIFKSFIYQDTIKREKQQATE